VNWYGAHEDDGVVSGLERTGRFQLYRTIARLGFNSVRLPFSLWMAEQTTPVPDEYLAANPDLSGATPRSSCAPYQFTPASRTRRPCASTM